MRHQHIAFLLGGALVGAMLASSLYQRWPDAQTALLGNVGWLPFLVAVSTLIFLGLNSRIAHQGLENTQNSLRHAQRAELGTRYQKGLELLESNNIATRVGGIAVLRDVALAAPGQYWRSVSDVLINLIEAASEGLADKMDTAIKNATEDEESARHPPSFSQTPRDVVMALEVLGLKDRELRDTLHEGKHIRHLSLRRIALSKVRFYGLDMRHIHISEAYFSAAEFYTSDFRRANVSFTTMGATFELCTFDDAKVSLTGSPWWNDTVYLTRCVVTGATLSNLWQPLAQLKLTQCDVTRTEVKAPIVDCNGCWFFGDEPSITAPSWLKTKDHKIDVAAADGLRPLEKAGRFLVFRETRVPDPDEIPF